MDDKRPAKAPALIRITIWWFTIQGIIGGLGAIFYLIAEHGTDPTWTGHQRSHMIWAGGKLLAISILMILISWVPFRRGEPWAWVSLLVIVLISYGSLVIGYIATGWRSHFGTAPLLSLIFTLTMLLALISTYRYFFGPGARGRGPGAG